MGLAARNPKDTRKIDQITGDMQVIYTKHVRRQVYVSLLALVSPFFYAASFLPSKSWLPFVHPIATDMEPTQPLQRTTTTNYYPIAFVYSHITTTEMSFPPIKIHPILMHPSIYQLTLTKPEQTSYASLKLSPRPPQMPLYRGRSPDPIREEYLRNLVKWREKRYFEEIDYILHCWNDPAYGTFANAGIADDDITRLRGRQRLRYRDGDQIRVLGGHWKDMMFEGLHYESDEEQQGQSQTAREEDKKTKSYEERHREAVEARSKLSAESNNPGKSSVLPSAGLPPGVASIEVRIFARDRYSMWARPVPRNIRWGHPQTLKYMYDEKEIDWKKPEFSGLLLPEYIIERGQREVERGYIWGIPYHAYETTRRRLDRYPESEIYSYRGLEWLLRIEHWYLSKSDEEAQQLDPNDLLTWDIPERDQKLLKCFIDDRIV